jgi:hypothetical protein
MRSKLTVDRWQLTEGATVNRQRSTVNRLAVIALSVLITTFAIDRLWLLYAHKFYDVTGRAQWIWAQHQLSRNIPVAFFATRDFDLPPNRYFTKIKIAGDPEYTLWFNGTEIGGRKVGDARAMDVYDVTPVARTSANRMVIGVRSRDGVGGIIASVDIAPDYQNVLVTDEKWHIVRRWMDDLMVRDPEPMEITKPMRIGRPPIGRWNYLARQDGKRLEPPQRVIKPLGAFDIKTGLPRIDVLAGVAVTVVDPKRATVYEFGPTTGRARLTLRYVSGTAHAINVRFANERSELFEIEGPVEPFVFAAGEQTIVDPVERRFNYVMVYGGEASVEVLQ